MQSTVWTYPWDVQDVGLNETLDDILGLAGAEGVSLAVSYHAGKFVQARSPRRKVFFPEDGTVYFHPTPSRYDRLLLKPQVAAIVREGGDVLAQLQAAREKRGFRLNAWTVCLHNSRLGHAHPAVTVQNAFGDRYPFSLCPSHPEARAYVTTLIADMTARYELDSVELETPTFMGFVHEYHHEKDGVGLTPRENFLFSLCFCGHCRAWAARAGVDAEAARLTVARWIIDACKRPLPEADDDFPARGLDTFADAPEVQAYLRWRTEPVTSLLHEIRAAAHHRTQVYLLAPMPGGAWQSGLDFAAAARALDGMAVIGYGLAPADLKARVAEARALVPADRFLSTGLRAYGTEMAGGGGLADQAAAAAAAGSGGLHFYNYGLVPRTRLDWVKAAIAAAVS